MRERRQYCTFYVAGQCFGLDVLRVQEVIRYQAMTRVPLAPTIVRGLINLRGRIVTAIDLRRRLGIQDQPGDHRPVNVVVHGEEGPVSLLVDEIGDVLDAPEAAFERPPDTLAPYARDMIRGTYKLKDRLLLILDLDKILAPEAGAMAPAGRAALMPTSGVPGALEHSS